MELDKDPERTVEIPITVTPRDGAGSENFTLQATSVTINSGELHAAFTVTAPEDGVTETGEFVNLTFGTLPAGVGRALSGTFMPVLLRDFVQEAPSDWAGIPSGLEAGDEFRLLFVDTNAYTANPVYNSTYHDYVYEDLDNGSSMPVLLRDFVQEAPSDWAGIPSGLEAGDEFRLLFVDTNAYTANPVYNSTYHDYVYEDLDNGSSAMSNFGYEYHVGFLGSTAGVNARDHTGTTHTSAEPGVPIYWLGGPKVADDYADFYDGSWDHRNPGRDHNGDELDFDADTRIWTGSNSDGTVATDSAGNSQGMGSSNVQVGRPGQSAGNEIHSSATAASGQRHYYYGLSYVFRVVRSANADLSALTIDGTSVTGFAAATTAYTMDVENTTAQVTVAATASHTIANAFIDPADADAEVDGHQVDLSGGKNVVTVAVTAGDGTTTKTYTVTITRASAPHDWSLRPPGIAIGDTFRVLIVTSTFRKATSGDIGDYDAHVRSAVADRGHTDIIGYSPLFKALAGTKGGASPKNHTDTNPNSDGPGEEIWWLNGPKAADDYADFYDGWWDHSNPARTQAGNTKTFKNSGGAGSAEISIWTGTNNRGNRHSSYHLGTSGNNAHFGTPFNRNEVWSNGFIDTTNRAYGFYGLSEVLLVETPDIPYATLAAITTNPANGDDYRDSETITATVTFSERVTVTADPQLPLRIGANLRDAGYTGTDVSGTVLSFSYTVTADDSDQDGVSIDAFVLKLNGGSVKRKDADVDAALTHTEVAAEVDQSVNRKPYIVDDGVAVTSSPQAGTSTYGLGEDIEITVTFSEAVTVNGAVDFGLSVSGPRRAPLVDGNGTTELVFAYTVQAGDADDNGIWIGDPSHDTNPTFALQTGQSIVGAESGLDAVLEHDRLETRSGHKVYGTLTGADTTLSSLSLSGITLDQTFAATTESYTASAAVASTTVTATPVQSGAGVVITPTDADANTTDHQVTLAAGENTITVTVTATNGSSTRTYTITVTRTVARSDLPPPKNLRVVGDGGTVKLNWDAPDDATVTGYRIERRRANGPHRDNHTLVEDTGSSETGYTDQSAEKGVEYEYRVSARNADGAGEASGWVSAAPDEEPVASEDVAVWSATMTVEWVYQGYGYYSTDAKKAGSLSPASFEVDGTTYTVKMVETQGWMYIGVDRELPFDFVLELNGTRFASGDASFRSYSYGNIYKWEKTGLSLRDGDTVEVRLLRAFEEETAVNSAATGAPIIRGTVQVGETLTADTSGIADEDGLENVSFSYQWLADDAAIAGATDSTYTLADADEGKAIKVEVSFTDDDGNEETLTSEATDAVAAAPPENNEATGAPTISGTAQVGETLTVDTSGIADEDGLDNANFSYQWLADDADIAGATGSNYTLVEADEGQAIKVRVSFTDDAGNEEELTSGATDAVAAPEPPAKPTGLSATPSHDRVVLTWDDPNDDTITGYVILRRNRETDAQGQFTELAPDTGTAATTYTDETVAAETLYTYRIKAINAHGTSERSRWFHIDTLAGPEPTQEPTPEPESVSEGDTDLPNDNSTPGRVAVGGSATGAIGTDGDQDRFAVELEAGRTYQFDLTGSPGGGGTLPDTFFRAIYNSEGQYQADSYNDDFDGGRDSRVTFTATESGTYYARVSGDRDEVGSYTLSVTDVTPQ